MSAQGAASAAGQASQTNQPNMSGGGGSFQSGPYSGVQGSVNVGVPVYQSPSGNTTVGVGVSHSGFFSNFLSFSLFFLPFPPFSLSLSSLFPPLILMTVLIGAYVNGPGQNQYHPGGTGVGAGVTFRF